MADLVAIGVHDQLKRRKLQRQLEDIGDQVAERLGPMMESEFRSIPQNEKAAAIDLAVAAVRAADMSDKVLLSLDVHESAVSQNVLDNYSDETRSAGLGEQALALYEIVVRETCLVVTRAVKQLPAFNARAISELLSRSSRVTAEISDILSRLPRTSVLAPQGVSHDHDFLKRYQEHVSLTFDSLELFGLDTRNYRLRTSVTTAYLSLRVALNPDDRESAEDVPEDTHSAQAATQSSAIEAALANRSRVLLRGEAGSGKTTLLQWIAVNAARGTFGSSLSSWNGSVPFMVRLRSFSDGHLPRPEQLIDGIAAPLTGIMPTGWVHRQMEFRRAILLIDGVDELKASKRPRVRRWLRDLLASYPNLRVIVTSRPSAATSAWLAEEGFESALVEPMTFKDVEVFCHRWHDAVTEAASRNRVALPCRIDEVGSYLSAVLRHLQARTHLKGLATNPLMCAMLCALNLDRRKQLPPDRMRLYADALQLLIDRRDAERDIPATEEIVLDSTAKLAILQHLAWRLSLSGRAELPRHEAELHVRRALERMPAVSFTASDVLAYLLERSGVIREPVSGRVDFVHRTFQEYLAAKECAEDHLVEVVIQKAHLDQWRETVIMTAGHATGPQRDELLKRVLDRAHIEARHARRLKLLAAACLETVHTMSPEITAKIDSALTDIIPPRARRESQSVAMAGERVLKLMPRSAADLSDSAARASIWAAAYINGPDSLRLLEGYAADPRFDVQYPMGQVWRFYDTAEYVRRVLADAPLCSYKGRRGGHLYVEQLEHLSHLKDLNNLESVSAFLGGQAVDNPSVLDPVPNLVAANLFTRRPIDLSYFVRHQNLELLSIYGGAPDAGFQRLSEMPALTRLRLSLANASRHDMSTILQLSQLRELEVSETSLVGGLKALKPLLATLVDLAVTECSSVDDLRPLVGSPIVTLQIYDCPIVDLNPILEMPKLRHLWVSGTGVSDLSPVAASPSIERVFFYGNERIDLGPFSTVDRSITIQLRRRNRHRVVGRDRLGQNVRIRFV